MTWRDPDLAADALYLLVLIRNLVAHVDGHVAQVADHPRHLTNVVLHLILTRVVRDPETHEQQAIVRVTSRHSAGVIVSSSEACRL